MHGHRRANSFSTTATGSEDSLSSLPLPPILINKLNSASASKFAANETFVRTSEERRSFTNGYSDTLNSPRLLPARAYKGVTISRATPATIRFSVNPEYDWLFDMSRPRSPSKSWRTGPNDAGVPSLDQALASIKEQLAMLKSERIDFTNRIDDLTTEISETEEHVSKTLSTPTQMSRSPGQALRRIKSLEGRAHSVTNLNRIVNDSSDGEDNIYDDRIVVKRKRKTSMPSKATQSTLPSKANTLLKNMKIRRTNSNNRRSLQALETILDNSPHMYNSYTGIMSPDSTPESSPKLMRINSVHSINKINSKLLNAPRPSRSSSQTLYKNNGYNTLPCRNTSSSSSTICDDSFSDTVSIPDAAIWDECSLQSEGSMVFRISSATGQVEKVPHVRKLNTDSNHDKLDSPTHDYSPIRRHHPLSMYCIGHEDDIDGDLIMNFTEEPRPLSSCFGQTPPSTPKRTILLHSFETTV